MIRILKRGLTGSFELRSCPDNPSILAFLADRQVRRHLAALGYVVACTAVVCRTSVFVAHPLGTSLGAFQDSHPYQHFLDAPVAYVAGQGAGPSASVFVACGGFVVEHPCIVRNVELVLVRVAAEAVATYHVVVNTRHKAYLDSVGARLKMSAAVAEAVDHPFGDACSMLGRVTEQPWMTVEEIGDIHGVSSSAVGPAAADEAS